MKEDWGVDYNCAICCKRINDPWGSFGAKPNQHLPPICRRCEAIHSRGIGKDNAGSFMDRRILLQIGILAEQIRTEAALRQWRL